MVEIVDATTELVKARLTALGGLLGACVAAGAGVGFVAPLAPAEAEAYWRRMRDRLADGELMGWLALDGTELAGCVFLIAGMMPNQPHRGEVMKLLVDPARQRQGIATALMEHLEVSARAIGKTLLTLDTAEGDNGIHLYRRLGFQTVGVIPGYARAGDGSMRGTILMYKPIG